MHYRNGEDLDRRLAIVSYDNAIEVAIHTYLSLHPVQRQNRTYKQESVEKWVENFHSKIDFFFEEVKSRGVAVLCQRGEFIWYHEIRNGQYHVGGPAIPQGRELQGIRSAALWVFGVLFDVADVESVLEQHLSARSDDDLPSRNEDDDRLIDQEYGTVQVAGRPYYTSEILHAFDPVAYSELAGDIKKRDAAEREMEGSP